MKDERSESDILRRTEPYRLRYCVWTQYAHRSALYCDVTRAGFSR